MPFLWLATLELRKFGSAISDGFHLIVICLRFEYVLAPKIYLYWDSYLYLIVVLVECVDGAAGYGSLVMIDISENCLILIFSCLIY
uniref:Uncharacterized protein n=1 Tax=Arundo donax TaxID=35708 RepID=A0A0A9GWA7_ARUDO